MEKYEGEKSQLNVEIDELYRHQDRLIAQID